ncbi:RDD family protein [Pedobacter cryophilus]|uniref:RDD family protein n=1 Tax=Pedobacter cryophilus TaxID=2571271 RepID=A0A4U1C1A4_9SPHI|nr:RDD family protein [Pedobacter cryophilus]TKB98744.1 RDD family protein [Pedobacter cryophilus]
MNQTKYTLVINGKPAGPFTLEELKTQKVKPDSFLRTPLMDDYKEAHEFPELREFLGFAKQYTNPQYFAGFDLRMLASVLDWFIIAGIIAVLDLITILILDQREQTIFILLANIIIIPVSKFVYQVYLENAQQATLGKKMLNIRVTNLQGLKPTFNQILIRNLSKIISTGLFFFGYLYSFLNKKQQCLHDIIADTLVIKDRLV